MPACKPVFLLQKQNVLLRKDTFALRASVKDGEATSYRPAASLFAPVCNTPALDTADSTAWLDTLQYLHCLLCLCS